PLLDQTLEPLVTRDLAANILHPLSADVLRAALHPARIADLPIGPGVVLGILVLAGQRARAHRTDLQSRRLAPINPPPDLLNPFLAHDVPFCVLRLAHICCTLPRP